jgi:beta-lactamase regulating signal transducer with metallopeptidase domain
MTASLEVAGSAGWVVIHSVWIATGLASLLALSNALVPVLRVRLRYRLAFGVLIASAVLPAFTSVGPWSADSPTLGGSASDVATVREETARAAVVATRDRAGTEVGRSGTGRPVPRADLTSPRFVSLLTPWLGLAWLFGAAIGLGRTLMSYAWLRRLARHGAMPADSALEEQFRLLEAGRGRASVDLRLTSAVDVPCVIGLARPHILVPDLLPALLEPRQLDALLLHELEHVRRADPFAALLQAILEGVFFFNPAFRWISAQVRIERELCCDEAVVAQTGDRVSYARALARLIPATTPVALGALSGGVVLRRIRQILGASAAPAHRVVPVALLGTAVSMIVGAAALSMDLVPDPLTWAPYPDEAGVTWLWVTAVGGVSLDGSFRDVTGVDPEGWLRVEERRADGARWVVVAPVRGTEQPGDAEGDAGSGVRIHHFVDGRPVTWDDAARDWLARVMTTDPEGTLRLLERVSSGASGGNLTASDDAWTSFIHVAPGMLETFGRNHLGWTLFGLGGPHPVDPSRPRRDPRTFDVATEAQSALFTAHHLSAHGLITPADLEGFLHALEAQLRVLEDEELPTGR